MVMNKDEIKEILDVEDIDIIGIVSLDNLKNDPIYKTSSELLPGAKSIIVLAMEVLPEVLKHATPERTVGDMVMNDFLDRNTELVSGLLDWEIYKMVKRLHRKGYKGLPLTASQNPYDLRYLSPALPYKTVAELAGLGTIGWHSMLLTPEFGARVRLACVITGAPLPATAPGEKYNPCPECGGACIKVCPVKAIKQPEGEEHADIDKFACNNYLVTAGGCSQCLKVCPAGK
jgi:epoxyqueuosine reductase QueG